MSEFLYQFTVLRYMHDPVTEEFLNVGVVLYSPEARYLKARINPNYERLADTFQEINGAFYRRLAQNLENRLAQIHQELYQGRLLTPTPERLEQLLAQVLPPDDSSLRFSGFGGGLSADLDQTVDTPYQRLVTRYIEKSELNRRDDSQGWQQ